MRRLVRVTGFCALAGLCVAAAMSAAAFAAGSGWPKAGNYAGPTSEDGTTPCAANFGSQGCKVTFNVVDNGKRITGFTTADGYNGKCHYVGSPDHVFQFLVKVPLMMVKSDGSFTGTVNSTLPTGQFTGTFRVKGRFSSGKAHGTVRRVGVFGTCGHDASNPTTARYLETFTVKRT